MWKLLLIFIYLIFLAFSFKIPSEVHLKSRTVKVPQTASQRRSEFFPNEMNVVIFVNRESKDYVRSVLHLEHMEDNFIQENVYLVYFNDSVLFLNEDDSFSSSIYHVFPYFSSDKGSLNFHNGVKEAKKIEVLLYDSIGVQDLQEKLHKINNKLKIDVISRNTLSVVIPKMNKEILNEITNDPKVIRVDIFRNRTLTNKMANLLVQGEYLHNSFDYIPHHYGITGKEMLIGITDTGLDVNNCFFYDPRVPEVYEDVKMPSHRKIDFYKQFGSSLFEYSSAGHGTHVSGTAVGKLYEDSHALSEFNGAAPDARLYFQDIGGSEMQLDGIPNDITELLQPSFDAGVRVHSFSWGCGFPETFDCEFDCKCHFTGEYRYEGAMYFEGDEVPAGVCRDHFGVERCCDFCNCYCVDARIIDEFVYENDEMLVVVSAGNFGDITYNASVSCPGTSKNAIVVGASFSRNSHMKESLWWDEYDVELANEICEPSKTLSNVKDCNSYKGQSQLGDEYCVHQLCDPEYSDGWDWLSTSILKANENSLPYFSSRGPTLDGRVKPDVVAPGVSVLSAKGMNSSASVPHCEHFLSGEKEQEKYALVKKSGTSMSTPLVAALAVLIREYFVKGYYPSGKKNVNDEMENVSGTLVKAVLIHSAQKLSGWYELGNSTWVKIDENNEPNYEHGWGLTKIGDVLKFGSSHPTSDYLFVVRDREGIRENQKYRFVKKERGRSHNDLTVTITWYEKEGSIVSNIISRNDLDLFVVVNRGERTIISSSKVDNVEKVTVRDLKKHDVISIEVARRSVTNFDLKYSIVISGYSLKCENGFDIISGCNHCLTGFTGFDCQCPPGHCENGGYCTSEEDVCTCRDGYRGSRCQCRCENGWCIESNSTCVCHEGFTGLFCEEEILPVDKRGPFWKKNLGVIVFLSGCALGICICLSCICMALMFNFLNELKKRKYPGGFRGFNNTTFLDTDSESETSFEDQSETTTTSTTPGESESTSAEEDLSSTGSPTSSNTVSESTEESETSQDEEDYEEEEGEIEESEGESDEDISEDDDFLYIF